MLLSSGLVFGTMMFAQVQTSALQNVSIQRVDNNTLKVYVAKTQDIHISHAKNFEVIIDKGHDMIKGSLNKDELNIKNVQKGTTLNIDLQLGYTNDNIVLNGQKVYVKAN